MTIEHLIGAALGLALYAVLLVIFKLTVPR
jgi:hypothetical protein